MEVQNSNAIGAGAAAGVVVGAGSGLAVGASRAGKLLAGKGIKKGMTQDAFVKNAEDAAVKGIREKLTAERTAAITSELTSKAKDAAVSAETGGVFTSAKKFTEAMKKAGDSATATYKASCEAAKTAVDETVLAQKVAEAQARVLNGMKKGQVADAAGEAAKAAYEAAHPLADGAKKVDVLKHQKAVAQEVKTAQEAAKAAYVDSAFDVAGIAKKVGEAKPDEATLKSQLNMTREQKEAFSAKVTEAVKKVGDKAKETYASATKAAKNTKIKWVAALAAAGTAIGIGAAALISKKKAEAAQEQK